jgi:hypothetical protein
MKEAAIEKTWSLTMSSGQKMTLLALCMLANESGRCLVTVALIAEMCGTSIRATQGNLRWLESAKHISRSMPPGECCSYQIEFWTCAK